MTMACSFAWSELGLANPNSAAPLLYMFYPDVTLGLLHSATAA